MTGKAPQRKRVELGLQMAGSSAADLWAGVRSGTVEPRVWASHQGSTSACDQRPLFSDPIFLPANVQGQEEGGQWKEGLTRLPPLYLLV